MFVQIYRYKCLSLAEPTHTAVDLSPQRGSDAASHTDTSELAKHARKTPFFVLEMRRKLKASVPRGLTSVNTVLAGCLPLRRNCHRSAVPLTESPDLKEFKQVAKLIQNKNISNDVRQMVGVRKLFLQWRVRT